ncbi:MAG: hypothetical protein ATN35_02800 [Epulopiscium sp. Nele67-Bin004]|nr:MAG: hypothetical protein ATN35_02800 [Epulopiscium sp. Nele67-Bin004]
MQTITVGTYIALVKAIYDFIESISWQFVMLIKNFISNKLYLKDITEFSKLEKVENILNPIDTSVKQTVIQKIEFKNVTFVYPNTTKKILDNFTATMYGDKKYSIVGANGCGKTTLVKLLTGLYEDYDGDILINGVEIRDIKKEQLKAYFGIVYQDFSKYEISIKDNLLIEDPKSQQALDVLKQLGLDELIGNLENGLDTPLGKLDNNGIDLSGGQWQKIAIARTLISGSPINILDEPTHSLDPISEVNLYAMFKSIMNEKFTIFITHRLGGAKLADEIIVINKGKVAQQGTHQNLLNLGGQYAKMFEAQRSWYDEN